MKQIYILLIALLMGLSAKAESSGTCGANLTWHLTDDGVLTITGTGKMDNYLYSVAPWYYRDVKQIIIGSFLLFISLKLHLLIKFLGINIKIINNIKTVSPSPINVPI